jgi:YccJ-like protein
MTEDYLIKSRELHAWAQARETSYEIAHVIRGMGPDADRIWEHPTPEEMTAVLEQAWKLTDDDALYWGRDTFLRPGRANFQVELPL